MKAFVVVIVLIGVALAGQGDQDAAQGAAQGAAQAGQRSEISPEAELRILQATVRIDMAIGTVGIDRIDGNALGSMVSVGSEVVIVTHNHWAPLLGETSTIDLSTVDHTRMATITGQALFAALRYQDAGTIIFTAPPEVVTYLKNAQLSVPQAAPKRELAPGTVVWSAYFPEKVGGVLDVRAMLVETGNDAQLPAVYRIRSLEGGPNQSGDSGGGIWYDGALVGNMWAVVMEPAAAGGWQDSVVSDAAVLTW